jgi:hypothetical protein
MGKTKITRIGLDFDGVVAYNPFRIIRAPVTYIKKKCFGVKQLHFYVPQSPVEQFIWMMVHESSLFPAIGAGRLKQLSRRGDVEFHLVTARFHFLQKSVDRWLDRFGLTKVFTGVHLNVRDLQPHVHKQEMINKLKLDYFVEDNWDIVTYLSGKTKAKVYWIYNITDRNYPYPDKFPYLDKALSAIPL